MAGYTVYFSNMTERFASHIFMERSGVSVDESVAVLMRPPEAPLIGAEREQVLAFAHELDTGRSLGIETGVPKTLIEVSQQKALARRHTFHIDYFLDPANYDARQTLAEQGYDGIWDEESIKRFLVTSEKLAAAGDKTGGDLAIASRVYSERVLAERLVRDPSATHDAAFVEPGKLTCHYEPDKLLQKFESLLAYRRFYKQLGSQLPQEPSGVNDAKHLLLQMHRGKVNQMLAGLYPELLNLKGQLTYMEASAAEELDQKIGAISPTVERLFAAERQATVEGFYRRLDYVRNGVEMTDQGEGVISASPISQDLLRALNVHAQPEHSQTSREFSDAEMAAIDQTRWGADEVAELTTAVLGSWGELSADVADWRVVGKRTGPAADGKYQVVITPKQDHLDVSQPQKLVRVPEGFDRTLSQTSPAAGALLVVAHELAHVAQGLADQQLANTIPLAKIRGRGASAVREAGGEYQEAVIQEGYFGRHTSVGTAYVRALEVKISGGNRLQATRAFLQSQGEANTLDSSDPNAMSEAAAHAVNRTLRLYRDGGFDSQSLVYAEQSLIVGALRRSDPDAAAAFVVASGSFDVKDTAQLHCYGLLPDNIVAHRPAGDVMTVFRERYLPAILERNQP